MSFQKIIPAAALFALSFMQTVSAQNGIKPQTVFMYKNGFAWTVSTGKVNVSNQRWSLAQSDIPNMAFGSFWFHSPAGINFVKRETDTVYHTVFEPGLEDLIRSNAGKSIKISAYTSSGVQTIAGTISRVFETPADSVSFNRDNLVVAVIKTATGNVLLTKQWLQFVSLFEFGEGATYDIRKKVAEDKLTVNFRDKVSSTELTMVGLQQFSAWSPAYRLVLGEGSSATLTLGAEVSAGSSSINGAELNLVIGTPEFSYGSVLSRLVSAAVLPSYQPEDYYNFKTISNTSESAYRKSEPGSDDNVPVYAESDKNEDFFFYTIHNFSLQKGQAAQVQILESKVNVEHSYVCDMDPISMYSQPNPATTLEEAGIIPVYHFLKFRNPEKVPLTAGPVMVEKAANHRDMALGQPVLNTVPVGGLASVKLAQNLDLPVKQLEQESSRVERAKVMDNRYTQIYFDQITIKASVHVENQTNEEKTVVLKRKIAGKPLASDLAWNFKTLPPAGMDPNSYNAVTWEVKLKPGEVKDFNYSYQYFLRMN